MGYRYKEIYFPGRDMYIIRKGFAARGGKACGRSLNHTATSEQQKKVNQKNAQDRILFLILNNFREKSFDAKGKVLHGDRWITLTYAQKPASFEEAHKNLTTFLKKIKRKYKPCKYTAKTEETESGFVHHHLLISRDVPHDVLAELWTHSNHVDDKEIYSLEDLKLCFYFIKNDGSHKCARSKFTSSRNLVKPLIRIRTVLASSWRREPVPKRGYDIYDLQNYFDYFGFEAQEYILKRRC